MLAQSAMRLPISIRRRLTEYAVTPCAFEGRNRRIAGGARGADRPGGATDGRVRRAPRPLHAAGGDRNGGHGLSRSRAPPSRRSTDPHDVRSQSTLGCAAPPRRTQVGHRHRRDQRLRRGGLSWKITSGIWCLWISSSCRRSVSKRCMSSWCWPTIADASSTST